MNRAKIWENDAMRLLNNVVRGRRTSVLRSTGNSFSFRRIFDLSWLPARGYLTTVVNADLLLSDEPEEIAPCLRQLDYFDSYWAGSIGLGQEWGGGEVSFNTVFSPWIPSGGQTFQAQNKLPWLRNRRCLSDSASYSPV
ncbi:hypothetical protein [Paenarthrobacter sp. NPDC090522]|uniref:hypothetical protein n=1 Tax=Paenarthrobacter sp. NPDC090522 TaxID=3364383 RepID=UPI0037FA191D